MVRLEPGITTGWLEVAVVAVYDGRRGEGGRKVAALPERLPATGRPASYRLKGWWQ
jgi:hypothetical protein